MADKCRYFAGLVYPDSAPDDWRAQLKNTHGAFAISPLHEPGDGEKNHYHVIYRHSNTVSTDAAKKVLPPGIFANDHIEQVAAPRNYQRYLIHLDDPDKQQFEGGVTAIDVLNGFPLDLSRDMSKSELAGIRNEIIELIRENSITEYSDLIDLLFDQGAVDHLDYACNHTIFFSNYLSSKRWSERDYQDSID